MNIKVVGSLVLGCSLLWHSSVMAQGFAIAGPQTGMQIQPVQENSVKIHNKATISPDNGFAPVTPSRSVQPPKPAVKPVLSVPATPKAVVQSPAPAVKPVLSAPSIPRPASGSVMMAPKAVVPPAPTMSVQPAQHKSRGFAPVAPAPVVQRPAPLLKPVISAPVAPKPVVHQPAPAAKPVLTAPSISRPVSGSAIMAPKTSVPATPTMSAQPAQPKSRGFVPAVQAPALSVKPLSPVAPVSSSTKALAKPDSAMQKVAPGIMSKPAPVMQVPSDKNISTQGFVPIGSIGQQRHKGSQCNPLKDAWGCHKPLIKSVNQRNKKLADGKEITVVDIDAKNAKTMKVWRQDGGRKLLSTYKLSANGGWTSFTVPASLLLGQSFKDGTRMQFELFNPYGKSVYTVQLMHKPITAGQLNLQGKQTKVSGGFTKASGFNNTNKKAHKVNEKVYEPRIFRFNPEPAEKGANNTFMVSDTAKYKINYQIRFADEIVLKYDGNILWHKKKLNPEQIISDSVAVESLKTRFAGKILPKYEDFTLIAYRHIGFARKKTEQHFKVVYGSAKLVAPVIKTLEVKKVTKVTKTTEFGHESDTVYPTLHLVFQNAARIKLEMRPESHATFAPIKLEGQWNRKLKPVPGRDQVIYQQIRLPVIGKETWYGQEKVYIRATAQNKAGAKAVKTIVLGGAGKVVDKGDKLSRPWMNLIPGDYGRYSFKAGVSQTIELSYRNIKGYSVYYTDTKNCKIELVRRVFSRTRNAASEKQNVVIRPAVMEACLKPTNAYGLWGELKAEYWGADGKHHTTTMNGQARIGKTPYNEDSDGKTVYISKLNVYSDKPVVLGGKIRISLEAYGTDKVEAILEDDSRQQKSWLVIKGSGKDKRAAANRVLTADKFYKRLIVRLHGMVKGKNGKVNKTYIEKVFPLNVHKSIRLELPYRISNLISTPSSAGQQNHMVAAECEVWDKKLRIRGTVSEGFEYLKRDLKKGESVNGKISVNMDIKNLPLDSDSISLRCYLKAERNAENAISKRVKVVKNMPLSKLVKTANLRMPSSKLVIDRF